MAANTTGPTRRTSGIARSFRSSVSIVIALTLASPEPTSRTRHLDSVMVFQRACKGSKHPLSKSNQSGKSQLLEENLVVSQTTCCAIVLVISARCTAQQAQSPCHTDRMPVYSPLPRCETRSRYYVINLKLWKHCSKTGGPRVRGSVLYPPVKLGLVIPTVQRQSRPAKDICPGHVGLALMMILQGSVSVCSRLI